MLGSYADSETFVRGGPTLTTFFYFFFISFISFNERRNYLNASKSGPSSARQRNAIQMVFRWRADDGPTLNSGLVAL